MSLTYRNLDGIITQMPDVDTRLTDAEKDIGNLKTVVNKSVTAYIAFGVFVLVSQIIVLVLLVVMAIH